MTLSRCGRYQIFLIIHLCNGKQSCKLSDLLSGLKFFSFSGLVSKYGRGKLVIPAFLFWLQQI